jgi:hypothetical protein
MTRSLAAIGLLLLLGAPVRAEPAAVAPSPSRPADDSRESAKRHFERGVSLYQDGDYNGALAEFQAAYQAHAAPTILYNIALTQKALFLYDDATTHFRRYLAEAWEVPPDRRDEVEHLIAEMDALMADYVFAGLPARANIRVDGRAARAVPIDDGRVGLRLAAGHRVVEVTAEDYRPERRELNVVAGAKVTMDIALVPIPKTGRVLIAASHPGAKVKVDGHPAGTVPVEIELTPGGHALEVWASGFRSSRRELLVAAGQSRSVTVELERLPPPAYRRWWFWTIGAAVAGGVAAGIAVPLSQRTEDAIPGSLGLERLP